MDTSNLPSQEEILQLMALSELFGGFAHEIAQPLNAIMIASQVIQLTVQRSPLAEEEKSFLIHRLGIVSSQVQRATQIVETLRGFSQPKSSVSIQGDLKASFERVYGLMGQQFVGRGVQLTWESHDPLPRLSIEAHLVELILVQGLAFSRSSVVAIGEWHDEKGISFDRRVQVELRPKGGRSVVSITWNGGELPGQINLIDPSTHVGLANAGSVIRSFGGDLQTLEGEVSIIFP
jgi:nitrogen-specific signal transduction histidine kinase